VCLGILEGDEILSVNNIDIEQAEEDIVDLQNALAGTILSRLAQRLVLRSQGSVC
jgi:hypothetical protein